MENSNVLTPDMVMNDAYIPIYNDTRRYKVCKGSRGSGKSVAFAQIGLLYTMLRENNWILVTRKVGDTLRDSVYKEFKNVADDMGIYNEFKWRTNPLSIRYGTNLITFKGADDPQKIKSSARPNIIWMEEAYEFSKHDFETLDLSLRGIHTKYPHEMWITLNPMDARHWIKKEFYDEDRSEDALVMSTTYKDNRFLDKPFIKRLMRLKRTDPQTARVLVDGEWGVPRDGLVYPDWKVE